MSNKYIFLQYHNTGARAEYLRVSRQEFLKIANVLEGIPRERVMQEKKQQLN